jgi:stearoyl-CoA desaturase (delta-9 desaturase)
MSVVMDKQADLATLKEKAPAAHSSLPLPSTAQKGRILWIYVVPIVLIHLAALLAFVPYFFSWTSVVVMLVSIEIYGLGISLGYHRLLAHRSLKVPKWLEHGFAMFAACSLQDTPAKWVANHRMHHIHSDEQEDPHSPMVNFFWSHFEWLFVYNSATRSLTNLQKYARDLLEDPFYMLMEKTQIWPAIYAIHAVLYFAVGYAIGYWNGGNQAAALQFGSSLFVWGVLVRTVINWHITWSVNSLSHIMGYRNYNTSDNSRNNWIVGLFAVGEGWHNNHHADPASASVWHRWWEVDLTYTVILCLKWVGLATDVIEPRHKRLAASAKKS